MQLTTRFYSRWGINHMRSRMFVWFVAAAIWIAARGLKASTGWRRMLSTAGMWCAILVSLWMFITFALDTPVVAELYFLFVGTAIAAAPSAPRAPARVP